MASVTPTATTMTTEVNLAPGDANAAWAGTLRNLTAKARILAEKRSGLTLSGPLNVISLPNEREFQRYLNARLNQVVAVARPARSEIVILRPALFAESPADQEQTLTHEITHMLIAQHVQGPLPAWLEEGLCMIVAGQEGLGYSWRMTMAGSLGGTLPLGELERSLLYGGDLQALAYAQGLSLTRFYIRTTLEQYGRRGDSPATILQMLSDPDMGPRLLNQLLEPIWLAGFEARWRREHRSVWNWIAIVSGASVLWLVISFLFLLAYWRKRRMSRLKREAFEDDAEYYEEDGGDDDDITSA
ncbi:hypothetical protein LLG95_01055 [bacterium]|nr:hypothetical protein [bacterium]